MATRILLLAGLLALGASAAIARAAEHPVLTACKPDIAHFCSNVPPGQGRIKECMKAHLPELSEPCKEALFQAWLKQ
ncbi:MAG TPA: cysteine rich repeat-containing protein [Candidatus Eisenbacteria bacterium]|nr:cysteine rich repeat-containing protein [Candidatus Eisenbacteria bacterium]